jgi:hypothetical protein
MENPDTLLCELCGCEARVVKAEGLNRAGEIVTGPKTIQTADGLFIFLDCVVHGRVKQCIASPSEAEILTSEFRQFHRRPQLALGTVTHRRCHGHKARTSPGPVLLIQEEWGASDLVPLLRETITQAAHPFSERTN